MACYFWAILDEKFPIKYPYLPCDACGSTMPKMYQVCPNCGADCLTEEDILALQREYEIDRWAQEAEAYNDPNGCSRSGCARHNADGWGSYSSTLCQECGDGLASSENDKKDAYYDEIG